VRLLWQAAWDGWLIAEATSALIGCQDVGDFRREVAQLRQRDAAQQEELESARERLDQLHSELRGVKDSARANLKELERLRAAEMSWQQVCRDALSSFGAVCNYGYDTKLWHGVWRGGGDAVTRFLFGHSSCEQRDRFIANAHWLQHGSVR
jgi:hypothetical protein